MPTARNRAWLFSLLGLCALVLRAADPVAPLSPPDWNVEVLLKHPQIRYPSALACAPDGRLFIAEDPIDMEGPKDQPIDRVICRHPDGRLTVYATNLHCVFGLLYLDGKLYVNHAPKLSVFKDGGDVATDREDWFDYVSPRANGVLLTGAGSHIPANLRLGMDGFIYMAVGDAGLFGMKDRGGNPFEMRGGGIARFRPDGTGMEIHSIGTRNHPDLAINAEDEIFTYDNTDDGLGWWTHVTHMVDGGYYGYPWDYNPRQPYTLWRITELGSGSGTGALAYNEDGLPAEYHGNIFFCDFGRQQLLRLKMKPSGGTYDLLERVQAGGRDFLTPGDSEFRPTALALAPDGTSVYIADWNSYLADVAAPLGRIFKLTYTGSHRGAARPDWWVAAASGKPFTAETKALVEALKHPAQSVRLVAQRRLAARGAEARAAVLQLLTNRTETFHARAAALWTLDASDAGQTARAQIISSLSDPDPALRSQAARQLGIRKVEEAVGALRARLKDDDLRVQFHASTALGRIGDPTAIPDLQNLLAQSNLFPRYAAFTALNRIGRTKPESWDEITKGFSSTNARIREGTLFAIRETRDEQLIAAISRVLDTPNTPSVTRVALIELLAAQTLEEPPWDGSWWGVGGNPASRPRPRPTQRWAGTEATQKVIRKALEDKDDAVRSAALTAVADLKDTNAIPILTALLGRETQDIGRKQLLAALGAIGGTGFQAEFRRLINDAMAARPSSQSGALLPMAIAVTTDRACVNDLLRVAESSARTEWRVASIEKLAALADSQAAPAILALAGAPQNSIAIAAVRTLGILDHEMLEREAPRLLADSRLGVRQAIVHTLALKPTPPAAEVLRNTFRDLTLRNDVIKALARKPEIASLGAYFAGLISTNAETVDASITAITSIEAEAIPALERSPVYKSIPPAVLQRVSAGMRNQPFGSAMIFGPLDPGNYDEAELVRAALGNQAYGGLGRWQTVEARPLTGRLRLGFEKPNTARVVCVLLPLEMPKAQGIILSVEASDLRGLTLNGENVLPATYVAENGTRRFREFATQLSRGRNLLLVTIGMNETAPLLSVSWTRSGPRMAITNNSPDALTKVALTTTGNATNGEALFYDVRTGCARCHAVDGSNKKLGPSLKGAGARLTRAQLIDSILYPSRQILHGFQQVSITRITGEPVSGLATRDDTEVWLLDASGVTNRVRTADIRNRSVSNVSLMPEGLGTALTTQEFTDLIAYLQTLK